VVVVAWERVSGVPGGGVSRDDLDVQRRLAMAPHGTPEKPCRSFTRILTANRAFVHNDGERYRYGSASAPFCRVDGQPSQSANASAKKQQMQWTKRGAHLLLQTRVKTLNRELGAVFQRWYHGSATGGRAPGGVTPSYLMVS